MFALGSKISSVTIDKIDILSLLKDNISSVVEQIGSQEDSKEKEVRISMPTLTNNFINKYLKGNLSLCQNF